MAREKAKGEAGSGVFAARLERIMDLTGVGTADALVDKLHEHGHRVSRQTVYNLLNREGEPNPTQRVLLGLATVFGVPLDYFADTDRGRTLAEQVEDAAARGESFDLDWTLTEARDEDQEAENEDHEALSRALRRQPAVRKLALRASQSDVTPEVADQVSDMLDILTRRRGGEADG